MKETNGQKISPLQSGYTGSIFLLYSAEDDNGLLQKDIISKILEIEDELLQDEQAQRLCLAVEGSDPVVCDFAKKGFNSGARAIVGQRDISTLSD